MVIKDLILFIIFSLVAVLIINLFSYFIFNLFVEISDDIIMFLIILLYCFYLKEEIQ